jgi:prepilin-type N-terminal cleavage/methylation domain-containing protein
MAKLKNEDGFTLIELVVVAVVTAILMALFYAGTNLTGDRAAALGRKLVSDLRYAQQLSNATQTRHGVTFNSSTQYTVFKSNDSTVPTTDPVLGNNFVISMTGDFANVTLSNTLTSGIVRFDSVGVPYEGANGSQTALATARTITVSGGGSTVKTITIEPNTGKIWMN